MAEEQQETRKKEKGGGYAGRATCHLEFSFSSEEEADILLQSIRIEDECYIKTSRDGCIIRAEAEAENPQSLLHTLNDYLSCLAAAKKVILPPRSTQRQHPPGPSQQPPL